MQRSVPARLRRLAVELTPPIVVRAAHLIEQGKTHDREAIKKALDGHICRCTGYGRILDAIERAFAAADEGQL